MNPTQIEHLIIGFGKAGKTLAKALASAGKSVILVEQSAKMYGGTCINIGCIPSKKLKFLAESNHPLNEAIAQKNSLIEKLNQANFDMVDKVATVITGKARFIDSHQVAVQTEEGEQIIQAEHIYINTGATNRRPDIQGIESAPNIYDSTSIMQLTEKPQQLVIIGGGYIGLEFASMFAQFGSKVTVLEVSDTFIGREDRAIANNLLEIMQRQGIEFKFSQRIQSLDEKNGQTLIHTEEGDLLADAVLISAGRSPNTSGLDLDKANIETDKRGAIVVNERLQTSQKHIYAMGDVAGSAQFTYISLDDYRVVKSQLLGDGSYTTKGRTFPYSVFTNPPLSVTGLNEETAKEQGYEVKTAVLQANAIPKAKILEQTDGLLKAVIDSKTDKVLGVQLLCAQSHELINFMDLAIRQGLTHQQLASYIFTHPTMSESLNDLFAQFS